MHFNTIISLLFIFSLYIVVNPLGIDEINLIIKLINDRRSTLAKGEMEELPSASNMNKLSYSKLFEGMAQTTARKCSIDGTSYGGIASYYSEENSGNGWEEVINSWTFEGKEGLDNELKPKENAKNFAQMFYAKNKEVGCGKAECIDKKLFVCFGQQQTMNGPLYEKGEICKKCETGKCDQGSVQFIHQYHNKKGKE
ncbi:hypothetical protein Mgra_00008667 [Meloidogyne graminicola]|uniref:SCP domain-containing protein n=1 Tax=Meloidogyne graminicola TaxID=189291 RepID=A0A8S9ZF39_9BILA|nr:hypothetical protein Mgra_00008667 [Meloidogyne graminicola]